MNVILLEAGEINSRGAVTLTDGRATHIARVLRSVPGAVLRVGILDGPLGHGTVSAVNDTGVELVCTFANEIRPRPAVDVLLALPRPKVLRRQWPHLAACGVGHVMLTNAAKVERDYFDSHYVRPDGFRPLLIEGLQQAGDTHVPIVTVHKQLRPLVEDVLGVSGDDRRRLVAHPGESTGVRQVLTPAAGTRVLLAIGPEGGWTPFELQMLEGHGFTPVGIGPRVLTTTAACIALLTLVHDAIR